MSNETQNAKKAKTGSAHRFVVSDLIYPIIVILALLALFAMPQGNRLPVRKVCFKDNCLSAEQAVTADQRERGLSGRQKLDENTGMLFVFDEVDQHCMWMKGMKFDLDIVWLDQTGKVLRIAEGLTPDSYPGSYCTEHAKYVLELNSGAADKLGVRVGDSAQL